MKLNDFEDIVKFLIEADDIDYSKDLPLNKGQYRIRVELIDATTDEVIKQLRHKISGNEYAWELIKQIHELLGGEETENPGSYIDNGEGQYHTS